MHLMLLGKETQGGGSPTLYATDRGTYLVQGWRVLGEPSNIVEIPESLLRHLPAGAALETTLHATGRRWRGDSGECATYTLAGVAVTDPTIEAELSVPDHEACVEVAQRRGDG
ncbi:hypothetical protein [Krasilnikovia sp. MM14-A1004]|uniref:hypothetical protein n=1 Tax=Krasilnikovia sp. MM14-A1004 TaxID=3373541 RepID=UPI00399C6D04